MRMSWIITTLMVLSMVGCTTPPEESFLAQVQCPFPACTCEALHRDPLYKQKFNYSDTFSYFDIKVDDPATYESCYKICKTIAWGGTCSESPPGLVPDFSRGIPNYVCSANACNCIDRNGRWFVEPISSFPIYGFTSNTNCKQICLTNGVGGFCGNSGCYSPTPGQCD